MASSNTNPTPPLSEAEAEMRNTARKFANAFETWAATGTLTPPMHKIGLCQGAAIIMLSSEDEDETMAKAQSMLEEIEMEPRKVYF